MKTPPIVSPPEWEEARERLLVKEKELTRARDAMAAQRRRMPWMAVEINCTEFGGDCSIDGAEVHIPAGASVEGNVAADASLPWQDRRDAHLTVIDQAADREYDLWQVQAQPIPSTGGTLNISWGGVEQLGGDGVVVNGRTGQGTAAHFADLAGRIRAEEFLSQVPPPGSSGPAGNLGHALFIVVNYDSGQAIYPAVGVGRPCDKVFGTPAANVNAPPMGAWLWLDLRGVDIQSLPIANWKKSVLETWYTYGAFIGDTGSRGYFAGSSSPSVVTGSRHAAGSER